MILWGNTADEVIVSHTQRCRAEDLHCWALVYCVLFHFSLAITIWSSLSIKFNVLTSVTARSQSGLQAALFRGGTWAHTHTYLLLRLYALLYFYIILMLLGCSLRHHPKHTENQQRETQRRERRKGWEWEGNVMEEV